MIYIHSLVTEFLHDLFKGAKVVEESECGSLNGLYIHVRPDSGRNFGNGIAYFKCYDGKDIDSAKVARISFYESKYIIHYKNSNKNLTLSSKQKKILMELLKSEEDGELIWIKMITEFNRFLGPNSKYLLPLNLPIPDYTKL